MRTNLSSEELMLGVVDLYKQILFSNRDTVFMESLSKRLDEIAVLDTDNTEALRNINRIGINSVRKHGERIQKNIENLSNK